MVAFKNCSLFIRCVTHLNDEHVETAENLWQHKRDKQNMNAAGNIDNVNANDSSSFKYKLSLLKGLTTIDVAANANPDIANAHRLFINAQIVVPLKYLSKFFRSLEMRLINCKLHLELNWTKNSVMSNVATATTFQIKSAKLYVPVVTLPTKESIKLTKKLSKGFKRSVFWNEYKSKIEHELENNNLKRILLDLSFQGVHPLFVLAFDNTENSNNRVERNTHQKNFLPRVNIAKYNVLIDRRNFYDQLISDQIRKYDELRKITTGKDDDYTTGCLLDYQHFKENYQLIACNLSQQKELDADPRSIQKNQKKQF